MLAQNQTLRAYLEIGGNVNVCDKFLITKDYLKLAKVVFDEEIHHRVLVVGPKGTSLARLKRNGQINEHRELVGAVEQR